MCFTKFDLVKEGKLDCSEIRNCSAIIAPGFETDNNDGNLLCIATSKFKSHHSRDQSR